MAISTTGGGMLAHEHAAWRKRFDSINFRYGITKLSKTTSFIAALRAIYGIGLSRAKEIIISIGLGISFRMLCLSYFLFDILLRHFKFNFFLEKRLQELVLQQVELF